MTDPVKTARAKGSRRRGKRGEYLLRDFLRKFGWTADRVPTSGAAQGFKGDVAATRGDTKLLFELKNHSNVFKKIYELYAESCKTTHDDVLAFACPGEEKLTVTVSTSLDALFDPPLYFEFKEKHPLFKKYSRTFSKIGRLQDLLGEADILVLRDDRKPFLFLRYR